jgi:SPP1 family predicted phage head-tail adaptor
MPIRVRVGTLNQRVRIQRLVQTPDSAGGQTVVWTDYLTLWGRVGALGGGLTGTERLAQQRQEAALLREITVRYRTDLNPTTHRVVWNGLFMEVLSVQDVDESRRFTVLTVKELVA